MRIISRKAIREAVKKHADLQQPLDDWYNIAAKAVWTSISDIRLVYPSADGVGNLTVFNIKGNKYRLIVGIDYPKQCIFIKYVLPHAEYSKEEWKNDPYF